MKDFQYLDDEQEHLKRYYSSSEQAGKFALITDYYGKNEDNPKPNLVIHQQNQIILKRNRKIRKLQLSKRGEFDQPYLGPRNKEEIKHEFSDEDSQFTAENCEEQCESTSDRKRASFKQENFVDLLEKEEKKKAPISYESYLYDIYTTPTSSNHAGRSREDILKFGTPISAKYKDRAGDSKASSGSPERRQDFRISNNKKNEYFNQERNKVVPRKKRIEPSPQGGGNIDEINQVTPKKIRNNAFGAESRFQEKLSGEKRSSRYGKYRAQPMDLECLKESDPAVLLNKYKELFKLQEFEDSKTFNEKKIDQREIPHCGREVFESFNQSGSPKTRKPVLRNSKQPPERDVHCLHSPKERRVLTPKKLGFQAFSRLVLSPKNARTLNISNKSQQSCNFTNQTSNAGLDHIANESLAAYYTEQKPSSQHRQARHHVSINEHPIQLLKRRCVPKEIAQLNFSKATEPNSRSRSKQNRTERSPLTERPQLTERQLELMQIYGEVSTTKNRKTPKRDTSRRRMRTERPGDDDLSSLERLSRELDPLTFIRDYWRKQALKQTSRDSSSRSNREAKKLVKVSPQAKLVMTTSHAPAGNYVPNAGNSPTTKKIRSLRTAGSHVNSQSMQNITLDAVTNKLHARIHNTPARLKENEILVGESEVSKFKANRVSNVDSIVESNPTKKPMEVKSRSHLQFNLKKLNLAHGLHPLSSARNNKQISLASDRPITFLLEDSNKANRLNLSRLKLRNNPEHFRLSGEKINQSVTVLADKSSLGEGVYRSKLNQMATSNFSTLGPKDKSAIGNKESWSHNKPVNFQRVKQIKSVLKLQRNNRPKSPIK